MLAIVLQGLGTELPRESLIASAFWLLGLGTGAALAHRHIIKPARKRHAEVMAAHRSHARAGGYELETPE